MYLELADIKNPNLGQIEQKQLQNLKALDRSDERLIHRLRVAVRSYQQLVISLVKGVMSADLTSILAKNHKRIILYTSIQ